MSTSMNRVMSTWDKNSDVSLIGNGRVLSNYILTKKFGTDAPLRPYEFGSVSDFTKWKSKNILRYQVLLQKRLTPH
jgi:hypothetical protein